MKKKLVVVFAAVALLAGCGERTPEQKARSEAAMKEIRLQRISKEYVAGLLRDPKSAEFRNQKGNCGEVNSKNAFGAYTGFQRYIAGSRELVVMERDSGMPASEFAKLWDEFCL